MSPSYNLRHLSPCCHPVYLSILLLYFPVPLASVLTSLFSFPLQLSLWWALSLLPFTLFLLPASGPPHQLRGLGLPRETSSLPSFRKQQECADGKDALNQTPPVNAQGWALFFPAPWTAPGIAPWQAWAELTPMQPL